MKKKENNKKNRIGIINIRDAHIVFLYQIERFFLKLAARVGIYDMKRQFLFLINMGKNVEPRKEK